MGRLFCCAGCINVVTSGRKGGFNHMPPFWVSIKHCALWRTLQQLYEGSEYVACCNVENFSLSIIPSSSIERSNFNPSFRLGHLAMSTFVINIDLFSFLIWMKYLQLDVNQAAIKQYFPLFVCHKNVKHKIRRLW